jgi:hypothetical protein
MLPLSNILDKINPEKNQSSAEFCLGLVISERKVRSAIWNLSGSTGEEITFGSSETWGNDSAEELIVAADASIATAVTKLPHLNGKQPTKVILGLPEHWVDGNGVNKKKSAILQALCKKLLLKSLGFVVTPEAIAHFLKKEEGGLPSIILLNLGETEMVVSLINEGKFIGSKVVGRSDSLALDLEEGLLRFDFQGALPHRMLLIEDVEISDIEELKQALVAYPWVGPENSKKLNFLQFPRVEIAEDGFEVRAVMIAGKQELGLAGEKAAGPSETVTEAEEKMVEEMEEAKMPEVMEENLPEEDFGFVKGEDITLTKVETAIEENPPLTETAMMEEAPPLRSKPPLVEEAPPEVSSRPTGLAAIASLPKKVFSRLSLPSLKSLPHLPVARPAFSFVPHRGLVLMAGALIFVLGTAFFGFWRFARAQVRVFVQPQKVEKEFEFSVSNAVGEVDREKMIVPSREVTVEVSGSKTAEVKGKKTVGDKAKGEVVIYNGSKKSLILAKGIAIKGAGNLRFILDQEAKVASASMDWATSPPQLKLGEAKVAVTAVEIGAQYNLAANSQFSLGGTPEDIGIKNPNPFSGGTSREIQAVSKEDRENLQKALLAELEEKAEGELKAKLGENDQPLAETPVLKSKTDRFSREVDDEASSLTLEEKATFALTYVKDDDFRILADKAVADLVPSGYQKEPLKEERSSSAKDKVKGIYTARVKEEFLPEMAADKIPAKLRGKTFGQGENYLKSLNQMLGMDVTMKPGFFSFLKIFPLRQENIKVMIEAL